MYPTNRELGDFALHYAAVPMPSRCIDGTTYIEPRNISLVMMLTSSSLNHPSKFSS